LKKTRSGLRIQNVAAYCATRLAIYLKIGFVKYALDLYVPIVPIALGLGYISKVDYKYFLTFVFLPNRPTYQRSKLTLSGFEVDFEICPINRAQIVLY